MSNTLKIYVANLWYSFHVKESKKPVWTIQVGFFSTYLKLFVLVYVNNENSKKWQLPKTQTLQIFKFVRINQVFIIYRKLTLNKQLTI